MSHMPFIWAAYRMGQWGEIEKGLSKEEFAEVVYQINDLTPLRIITAPNSEAKKAFEKTGLSCDMPPVGVVSYKDSRYFLEPHMDWFPWTTGRNKLEGIIRVILTLRDLKPLMIWCEKKDISFFTHIAKYGILRRVGTFKETAENTTLGLFQSKRKQ